VAAELTCTYAGDVREEALGKAIFTGGTSNAILKGLSSASDSRGDSWLRLRSPRALLFALGALGCLLLQVGFAAAHYAGVTHRQLPPMANDIAMPLEPLPVSSSWIIEGQPKFFARQYFSSPDGTIISGIWVCEGPGTFRWEHRTDESLYVLEGKAQIEYDGVKHELQPGDVTFFRAGTSTTWHVEGRVRKSFTLHNPGRIARWFRRVL